MHGVGRVKRSTAVLWNSVTTNDKQVQEGMRYVSLSRSQGLVI